jgi:hypothetical protein
MKFVFYYPFLTPPSKTLSKTSFCQLLLFWLDLHVRKAIAACEHQTLLFPCVVLSFLSLAGQLIDERLHLPSSRGKSLRATSNSEMPIPYPFSDDLFF